MDVLLLGAAAIVLIVLTVLIVWRAPSETVRSEDTTLMMPQGDTFEDQYTSATADLSAGGVAVTTAGAEPVSPIPVSPPAGSSPVEPVVRAEPAVTVTTVTAERMPAAPPPPTRAPAARSVGIGAAAALTLGGAAAGAWLYARWQRERNKPLNRLRRRFR
jgi:hypothetical protein